MWPIIIPAYSLALATSSLISIVEVLSRIEEVIRLGDYRISLLWSLNQIVSLQVFIWSFMIRLLNNINQVMIVRFVRWYYVLPIS